MNKQELEKQIKQIDRDLFNISGTPKYATVPLDAKISNSSSLTHGKTYKIKELEDETLAFGYGFWITSDKGGQVYGLERSCSHLENGNWILSETE